MLCNTCANKVTIQTPGQCTACQSPTTHFAYRLCSPCSIKMDECEWCQIALNPAPGTIVLPPHSTIPSVKLTQSDLSPKVNLSVGHEIHVILDEDQYSGREWDVKSYNTGCMVLKTKGNFVPNPNNPQLGNRTFVFTMINAGSCTMEFHEVHRNWSWGWQHPNPGKSNPVKNGNTWDAIITIA